MKNCRPNEVVSSSTFIMQIWMPSRWQATRKRWEKAPNKDTTTYVKYEGRVEAVHWQRELHSLTKEDEALP
ncbi:hypothetical protein GBA52_020629 [Prunus armeniaca]|nr:hypothetical protein GBA52_020629 [Prunus armeniaca]